MKVYADTSFLVRLVTTEPGSEDLTAAPADKALRTIPAEDAAPSP